MRKFLALGLTLVCLTGLLTACGKDEPAKTESKANAVQQKAPAKQASPVLAPKPGTIAKTAAGHSYVVAANDLSNLQLNDPSIPVYDLLSVQERRAKGLPTQLPNLTPYTQGKVAYLTFDDGPDGKNTPAILDVLKQEKVKATFYVLGTMCYEHPKTFVRIFNEGHAIGNHSYSHNYGRLYPNVNGFLEEMFTTERVMREILGFRSFVLRASGGKWGSFTKDYPPALKAAGLVEHDWNVCIDDAVGGHPTAADFVHKVDKQTANGRQSAIVLMHCAYGKEETVKALPQIIQLLRERGYIFGVVTPMTPQPY